MKSVYKFKFNDNEIHELISACSNRVDILMSLSIEMAYDKNVFLDLNDKVDTLENLIDILSDSVSSDIVQN